MLIGFYMHKYIHTHRQKYVYTHTQTHTHRYEAVCYEYHQTQHQDHTGWPGLEPCLGSQESGHSFGSCWGRQILDRRISRKLLLPSQRCSQDLRVGGCIGSRLIPPGTWSHAWDNGPQTNVKMRGNDTGQTERWEKQAKIEKIQMWKAFEMLYGISLLVM